VARRGTVKRGFEVQIKLLDTDRQGFHQYSGQGITREMTDSLATWLKKSHSAGRILDLSTGKIVEEWEAK
jgi:hypothetical protein